MPQHFRSEVSHVPAKSPQLQAAKRAGRSQGSRAENLQVRFTAIQPLSQKFLADFELLEGVQLERLFLRQGRFEVPQIHSEAHLQKRTRRASEELHQVRQLNGAVFLDHRRWAGQERARRGRSVPEIIARAAAAFASE